MASLFRQRLERIARQARRDRGRLALGDQIAAEWVPLLGIDYDRRGDILEIAVTGLRHRVGGPREVYADVEGGQLTRFEVIDDDGISHIVQLREPLMLPASKPAGG